MKCSAVKYSNHAVAQMFKRRILAAEVELAMAFGEVIKDYPADKPFPSCLIFHAINHRPLHVVVSQDGSGVCHIITVYEPDPLLWMPNFKSKI